MSILIISLFEVIGIYAQSGCCTNPGTSPPYICRDFLVSQENCCPEGVYDTATNPRGPRPIGGLTAQQDCIQNFFEPDVSCETEVSCSVQGCCCVNGVGSTSSLASCTGGNSLFFIDDGSEDFFSCSFCILANGCIGGEIMDSSIVPPLNEHQDGVCQRSIQICGDEGWTEYYGYISNYEVFELTCDQLDNDCDGSVDEGCDTDADGYCDITMTILDLSICNFGGEDCNDLDSDINPGADEICDGVDNNCDGSIDEGCEVEVQDIIEEEPVREIEEVVDVLELQQTTQAFIYDQIPLQPEFDGYIVQLAEKPLVVEEKELEEQAEENENSLLNPLFQLSTLVLPTALEPILPSNVQDKVEIHRGRIREERENFKQNALTELGKSQINLITGNTVSEQNPDELVVLSEYENVFNGIALDINDDEAELIKELENVVEVYPNYRVNITLSESVPLINADDVWLLDEDGNLCADTGKDCLTGKGITIGIIDTGVDYMHGDLCENSVSLPPNPDTTPGTTAKAIDIFFDGTNNIVVWSDDFDVDLRTATTSGENFEIIYGGTDIQGVAVLETTQEVFWTERFEGVIKKADIDGSNVVIIVSGLKEPYGIVIDEVDENLYWTDAQANVIQRADFDGSSIETIVSEAGNTPRGIAINPINNKIYWTIFGDGVIKRADKDGSNVETIVSDMGGPIDIAIDEVDQKLFLTAFHEDRIYTTDFDGNNKQSIIVTDGPRNVALDTIENKVYWTEFNTGPFLGKIFRANKDGSDVEEFIYYDNPFRSNCLACTDCKVVGGYDFINNDDDPMDDHGHGTHVAATAAGNGVLKGVAPDAKIYAYKVLDSGGSGSFEGIIASIERSVDPNQDGDFSDHLDIISLSLGGFGNPDDPMSQAIDNAVDAGVIAVIAAGNSGPSSGTIGSPGTARKAITVGATDKSDNMASFSSRGPVIWEDGAIIKPDVVAPGVGICAAQWDDAWADNECLDTEHTAISGTSMATPHVSGAVALIKQANPDWTPIEIKMALRSTTVDLGFDILTQGYGKIDVLSAVGLTEKPCVAQIDSSGLTVSNIIDIFGSAYCDSFDSYSIYHGEGIQPESWNLLSTYQTPVDNGILHSNFNTRGLSEGYNAFKLQIINTNGRVFEDMAVFQINNVDISYPTDQTVLKKGDIIDINGSVFGGEGFINYVIEYSKDRDSLEWFSDGISLSNGGTESIENDTLAQWGTSGIEEPFYALRIIVNYESTPTIKEFVDIILDPRIKEGWPVKISEIKSFPYFNNFNTIQNHPLIQDFDGDGYKEILVSSLHESWILTHNGNVFQDQLPGTGLYTSAGILQNSPAYVDLDDDGEAEIIISGNLIQVYEKNEENQFTYRSQKGIPDYFIPDGKIIFADINGNGKIELIFIALPRNFQTEGIRLYVLDNSLEEVEGWPKEFPVGYFDSDERLEGYNFGGGNRFAVGDVDGDSTLEIILLMWTPEGNKITIFNNAGEVEKEFFVLPPEGKGFSDIIEPLNVETGPILADLDNDGALEIGFSYRTYNSEGIYDAYEHLTFFDYEGNEVEGWPYLYEGISRFFNNYASPIIGDINNDGNVDIVTWRYSAFGNIDSDMLVALDSNGNSLEGFPFYFNGNTYYSSPIVADVDADGIPDIILPVDHDYAKGYEKDSWLYFIGNDGNQILERIKIPYSSIEATTALAIDDIDNDNKLELIAVTSNHDQEKGLIFAWDLDATYNPETMDWPMFQHDPQHTGLYGFLFPAKDRIRPVINGALNNTLPQLGDVINATFYATDNINLTNGTIVINDTGFFRYFNFSFEGDTKSITMQFSQNFTVSCDVGCVISVKGIARDNSSNQRQKELTVTVPFFMDIGIFDLQISEPIIGEPIIVNGTVRNLGIEDVNAVVVEFRVDGNLLGEILIPEIKSGEEIPVEFEWLLDREGFYSLELRIVNDDENSDNNFLFEFSRINFIAPDLRISTFLLETTIIDTGTNIEFDLVNFGEEKAEDVKAYLYDFYEPGRLFFSYPFEEDEKEESKEEEEIKEQSGKSGGGGGGGAKRPREGDFEEITYNGTTYLFLAFFDGTIVTVNVSTDEFNESLHFTSKDKLRRLQNGIYLYNEFFSRNNAFFVLGNASVIERAVDDIDSGEKRIENIQWTPTIGGNYQLLLFVNTSKDSDFRNNYYINFVRVLGEGVNIKAKLLIDFKNQFIINTEANVSVEIKNIGTEDAENIQVTLFEQTSEEIEEDDELEEEFGIRIRYEQIDSLTIDSLDKGESQEINFSWTPTVPGPNYLFLIAETRGDVYPRDNDILAFVDVLPSGSDVFSVIFHKISKEILINDNFTINGFISNKGQSEANNVSALLYEVKDETRKLVGNQSIGTLGTNEFFNIAFNWTPESSGETYLELVAEAANDGNDKNNMDSMRIFVLVRDFDVKPTIEHHSEFILANENAHVSVLLQNFGIENTPEFNLILRANGEQVESIYFDTLSPGLFGRYGLNWVPLEAGDYELEVFVDLDDADISNNIDTVMVKVVNTKNVNISFVDKDGNFVRRIVAFRHKEVIVEESEQIVIPDTPVDMWIGKESLGIIASLYRSSNLPDELVITSSYIEEPVLQDGLLLYEILANNDSWDYDSFFAFLDKRLEVLDIRFTELLVFLCDKYDFDTDACDDWQETPSDMIFSGGNLFLTLNAIKVQAFAIGDLDYDEDNIPDWDDNDNDNDGIPDAEDSFICANGRFKSSKFNLAVNDDEDLEKVFTGKNNFYISDGGIPLAEFDIDFDRVKLDCREVLVEKQPEFTTRGYTIISGIGLTEGTKTVFVDKIAARGEVCIKDEEIETIDEITEDCIGSNEYLVVCNSTMQVNYNCTDIGDQYKVEGLIHSGVAEPPACDESWSCTSWSACSGGTQIRSCTDANFCGTSFNKSTEQQSCSTPSGGGGGSSTVGGRGRVIGRGTIFDIGEIKGWTEGRTQIIEIKRNDLITFNFNNRYNRIVLNWIQGTRISISTTFKINFILLNHGETKNFDIDYDGKQDISITFEDVSLNKVTLLLKRINSEILGTGAEEQVNITEQIISTYLPQLSEPEDLVEVEKEDIFKKLDIKEIIEGRLSERIVLFSGIISVAIVILIVFFIKTNIVFHIKKSSKKEKTPRAQKKYHKELQSYIIKQLKKAGWPKDVIKRIKKNK